MIFRLIVCLVISFSLSSQGFSQKDTASLKPMTVADPTIFYYNKLYYLYGTGGRDNAGIPVYTSTDLQHWNADTSNSGLALKKGESYGTQGFWAPQVFNYKDLFYMAYTANEQIAIATSNHPTGPFKQTTVAALPSSSKQIDPFVFIDNDGKKYLYHVRLQKGNRIFVATLKDDFSGIVDSTLKECLHAELPWENTAGSDWPVSEGPTVVKKFGKYWMFYSVNDFRNPDYAIGVAVSKSPWGPWQKLPDNPLLSRKQTGKNGTGHGDLFTAADGKLYYVFHTHFSNEKVGPRKTMLIKLDMTRKGPAVHVETIKELEVNK